jgi:hypothetical protein
MRFRNSQVGSARKAADGDAEIARESVLKAQRNVFNAAVRALSERND